MTNFNGEWLQPDELLYFHSTDRTLRQAGFQCIGCIPPRDFLTRGHLWWYNVRCLVSLAAEDDWEADLEHYVQFTNGAPRVRELYDQLPLDVRTWCSHGPGAVSQ